MIDGAPAGKQRSEISAEALFALVVAFRVPADRRVEAQTARTLDALRWSNRDLAKLVLRHARVDMTLIRQPHICARRAA